LHVDWLFLGVHGFDERAGLTTPNLEEAETNRALIASARQVVVTADSTKWGVVGLSSMARLDDVDVVVCDDGLDPEGRRILQSRVGRLVIATTTVTTIATIDTPIAGADPGRGVPVREDGS
jgi:DeoR/GlpR family transcriptional regulator of sugar metabolism